MTSTSKPAIGPTMPSSIPGKRKHGDDDEPDTAASTGRNFKTNSRSSSPVPSTKKTRVIGPTLPPHLAGGNASVADTGKGGDSESSSDDDFGPSLPTVDQSKTAGSVNDVSALNAAAPSPGPVKAQRDEWMLLPPSSGDWTSRVDPTKLKNRKFNSGKGAKGPSQGPKGASNPEWTETTEEKISRLQKEMLGIKEDAPIEAPARIVHAKDEEQSRQLKAYNESTRGASLFKQHQKTNPEEKEDDPSARTFDREKDIAAGIRISNGQKREMMKKAADFDSRFSSGKFL